MRGFTSLLLCFSLMHNLPFSTSGDTIDAAKSLTDGETIVSASESFAMGFFSPGGSKNRYLGIWYNKGPNMTVVWVANRNNPVTDSSGVLKLNETGILVLLNRGKSIIWSSNLTKSAHNPVSRLLDSGNLIVKDGSNSNLTDFLWQSFDCPCDTLLPGMKLGIDLRTGLNRHLTSWTTPDDPSNSNFTYQVETEGYPQLYLREGKAKKFRSGSWNGLGFSGAPQLRPHPIYKFHFVYNEKEIYYGFELVNSSILSRLVLTKDGVLQRYAWGDSKQGWTVYATVPGDHCDEYGRCGIHGSCNINNSPLCGCLKGFVPKFSTKWNTAAWSDGCVRRTPLSCYGDGFLMFSGLKLPDTQKSWFNASMRLKDCRMLCVKNCSCTAYAGIDINKEASGCLMWFGDLIDIRELAVPQQDIYIRMAATELDRSEANKLKPKSNSQKQRIIIVSSVLSAGILILSIAFILYRWKKHSKDRKMRCNVERDANATNVHQREDPELPLFDMATITLATDNFSTSNFLGQGGFGAVYKGMLEDGREIAVKRLSKTSSQGIQEFKNEVMHVAKLQHRNLVRLLGCCIQSEERMLVYEFMPNKSLDYFIFDENKSMLIDWPKRLHIINGIARGLLYLHQDSRHRIVHRDLKAGNVLLDSEMNPKISDFGLARSFGGNEIEASTKHVVGTYGYLSPEYAIHGLYSTKSDVFSFGVLVLEIVSGKSNRKFSHQEHHFNLLGHAWRLFIEGKCLEMIDASVRESFNSSEVLRSIQVGLLCVQRSPADRPSMSSVVLMLSGESTLPQPKVPGFFNERDLISEISSSNQPCSISGLTISQMEAR